MWTWKKLRELLKLAPEIKQVQILQLEPGDIVVLSAPGCISNETARRLSDQWEQSFQSQGLKCVVLGDGCEVQKVLRPAKAAIAGQ
jgi:hypothetical protein